MNVLWLWGRCTFSLEPLTRLFHHLVMFSLPSFLPLPYQSFFDCLTEERQKDRNKWRISTFRNSQRISSLERRTSIRMSGFGSFSKEGYGLKVLRKDSCFNSISIKSKTDFEFEIRYPTNLTVRGKWPDDNGDKPDHILQYHDNGWLGKHRYSSIFMLCRGFQLRWFEEEDPQQWLKGG